MNLFRIYLDSCIFLTIIWFALITISLAIKNEFLLFLALGYGLAFFIYLTVPFSIYIMLILYSKIGTYK